MKLIHRTDSLTPQHESPYNRRRLIVASAMSSVAIGLLLPHNIGEAPNDSGLEDRMATDKIIAEQLAAGPEQNDEFIGEFDFNDNPNARLALLDADADTDIDVSLYQKKATTKSAEVITDYYQIPQPNSRFELWVDEELSKKAGHDVLLANAIDSDS